jgi:plasmid stabilization system protein ParE
MIPIDFLPGACLDFDQSFDWYAERSEIAAGRFSNAFDVALAAIAANPEQFAAIDDRHREYLVKWFPFRIVYPVEPKRVFVVAVAHAKRRPNYWKTRG